MKKFLPILLLALLSMVVGCSTDGVDKPGRGKYSINGSVQKGPFVLGSTINIQSLDDKLNPTGQSYTASTNDDAGHFDLGSALSNKYAEIIATGYYFDEVVGDLSQGTLTLRSITDLKDGGATNVNLLTTLVYNRTQNLVKNSGKSIADATAQAERELFLALGIEEVDIPDVRFAKMDISQAGDHNALLLTISVALQYNRSTAALSELIAKLANDLADDGQIASDKIQSLYMRATVDGLAAQVRDNLMNRYNQLGVQNNVPHFDKYLSYFLDINGNGVADKYDFVILDESSAEFSAKGGEYTLSFSLVELENCEFLFSDGAEEWLAINTDGGACQLTVAYNPTTELREAEITIKVRDKDKSDNFYVSQQPSFHIAFSCDADASADAFSFVSDAEHFATELNEGNGVLLLTYAPIYIERVAGPFTSITIPDSAIEIRESAFEGCSSLTSITIPDSVTMIGESAFEGCVDLVEFKGKWATEDGRALIIDGTLSGFAPKGLSEYTIPEYVTHLNDRIFAGCSHITLFTFNSLTPPTLGEGVFDGIENLQISIPVEAVEAYLTCDWPYEYRRAIIELTTIDSNYKLCYTTADNQKLDVYPEDGGGESVLSHTYSDGIGVVVFTSALTTIVDSAFEGCSSLTSITMPDGVASIGNSAFEGCSSLISITMPDSVTEMGEKAFCDCSSLTSVAISTNLREIKAATFQNCSNLREVVMEHEDSGYLTQIGKAAFSGCSSLISINLPYEFYGSIGEEAFMNCSSLVSADIFSWVVAIERSAFQGCSKLSNVVWPNKELVSIGESAFSGCSSLASVTIGSEVRTIGDSAFANCYSLTEFKDKYATADGRSLIVNNAIIAYANASGATYTIPDSVTTISSSTFSGCSILTSVTIPDSVTTIGKEAFLECFSLENVYCKATTPPSLSGSSVFDSNGSGRKIYVPAGSVNAYKSAANWSEYASAIVGYDF